MSTASQSYPGFLRSYDTPANPHFSHIPPRYLEPRKAPETKPPETAGRVVPSNPAFAGVAPKYQEPKAIPPPPPGPPKVESPLEAWSQHKEHQGLARVLGFAGKPSKFMEEAQKADRSQSAASPRRIVEAQQEQVAIERKWKGADFKHHETFDAIMKKTGGGSPARGSSPAKKAPSTVGEYIRSGTPIKHDFFRTASPKRQEGDHRAESPKVTPWHSGGVVQRNFDELKKLNSKHRAVALEEQRVKEARIRRNSAVKPAGFTPRVAALAPVYQIPSLAGDESVLARSESPRSVGA